MDALLHPPIAFAHRGGAADHTENTLEAFRGALEVGATGLESDVWLTSDGVAVLHHDGAVHRGVGGLRRSAISHTRRDALPPRIPTLHDLFQTCGVAFELSLDVKDPDAAGAVVAVARDAGFPLDHLWLCSPNWEQAAEWRTLGADLRLVDSTRLRRIKEGPERRAATLADRGIDAINLHHSDWTGGLTTLFHRFERYAFGWDCQHPRVMVGLLGMGIDGLYSDHPERMVRVLDDFLR